MKKLLYFCLLAPMLFAQQSKPIISNKLMNQLGNQMFQIAATLALAWDNNAEAVFEDLQTKQKLNIPFNYKNLFFRLKTRLPEGVVLSKAKSGGSFYYRPIRFYPNSQYSFFSPWMKHFDHHRDKLLKIFTPHPEIIQKTMNKYQWIFETPNTVGIQIRTYSPCLHNGFPFLGKKYFLDAMNKFPDDYVFIICSDRIEWCEQHFKDIPKNIVFIKGNDHISDLFLLASCKHNIISNSTFGWWAAYLNQNQNKTVIAPYLWYAGHCEKMEFPGNWNGFYPKDWIILKNEFPSSSYEEMKKYPSSSL